MEELEREAGHDRDTAAEKPAIAVEQDKRKRGRPRKSSTSTSAEKTKTHKAGKAKKIVNSSNEIADLLIAGFTLTTSTLLKRDTSFNELELGMVKPALTSMIERLTPAALERVNAIAEPVMLLAGLSLWGMRVMSIEKGENGEREKRVESFDERSSSTSTIDFKRFIEQGL